MPARLIHLPWGFAFLAMLLCTRVAHGDPAGADAARSVPDQPVSLLTTPAAKVVLPVPGQTLSITTMAAEHPSEWEGQCEAGEKEKEEEPSDLTLWNFFSAGWDQNFKERSHEGRAPRLHLFKTRQGFLEREFRFNYSFARNADAGAIDEHEFEGEIEYALNRRFLMEFEPRMVWERSNLDGTTEHELEATWVAARLALVDTYWSAYAFDFRIVAPANQEAHDRTRLGFFLAGFEDLTRFGFRRVGLYFSSQLFTFVGPLEDSDTRSEVNFGISIAKTFTDPDTPLFGDFTLFLEAFDETALDGDDAGRSAVTLTPGFRFKFYEQEKTEQTFWIMSGVEFPISGPNPFDYEVHVAFIWEFE